MKNPLKLIVFIGIALVLGYILKDVIFNDKPYITAVQKERKEKNRNFKMGSTSPLADSQKVHFDSLSYFAPDKSYALTADLEAFEDPETVQMPLTDGKTEGYLKYGKATFELGDKVHSLVVFLKQNPEPNKPPQLFVPFTDQSNGFETYGGGRYLDVPMPAQNAGTLVLDFNKAYNPFCAYNAAYSCPVPPKENRLPVKMLAGEKTYAK
jgi:uncharacterized protein